MDEEAGKEYRWETGYEKTWEAITEDGDGLIDISVQDVIQKARRSRMLDKQVDGSCDPRVWTVQGQMVAVNNMLYCGSYVMPSHRVAGRGDPMTNGL